MGNSRRKVGHDPQEPPYRPEPRTALERAERIADDLEGMREDWQWDNELRARFRDAGPRQAIEMWKSGLNERGKPLNKFELQALAERWGELFGFLPPTDGAVASPSQPQPADDTMLDIEEVARLTGLSVSSINRKYRENPPSFPPPTKLSVHRKGWPTRVVKDWLSERAWRR